MIKLKGWNNKNKKNKKHKHTIFKIVYLGMFLYIVISRIIDAFL